MANDGEDLERRIMELELRSEERRDEIARLEGFISGYEERVARLERALQGLHERLASPAEPMPSASEDLPPHY